MDDGFALDRARPGERWVIRIRLPNGSATDVVGWLEEIGPAGPTLQAADGTRTVIDNDRVVVARRAPAAAGGPDPLRTSAEALERYALPGWLADSEPLGEWTLRAGGGFTGRANSCLAVGDPGMAVSDAATSVVRWSTAHGIEPRAQVIVDSAIDRALSALGWRETYVVTSVMVNRLVSFLGTDLPAPDVRVTEDYEPAWLTAYRRSRPNDVDPATLRAILAGHPPRAFASVAAAGSSELVAIARGHLSGPWLGLASIWTDPEHRRRGLATAMMRALGHWAARRGARYSYLQVAAQNTGAVAAYERLGFRRHHAYRYLTPSQGPGS